MSEDLDSSVWRREIREFLTDFESEMDRLMAELKVTQHPPGSELSNQRTQCRESCSSGESGHSLGPCGEQ